MKQQKLDRARKRRWHGLQDLVLTLSTVASCNCFFVFGPNNPAGCFHCSLEKHCIPVDFVIVGKLAQTVFPRGAVAVPFEI
jgi:hypothetical protein